MNSLSILSNATSLYVEREEISISNQDVADQKVVSFYEKSIRYNNLPLEEKWKYRKAVNELQVLINKIQSDELNAIDGFECNLPEVVQLLRIRKEMLSAK